MSERTSSAANKSEPRQQSPSLRIPKPDGSLSAPSLADQFLMFQKTLGNQALQRLFLSGAIRPKLTLGKPNDIHEQDADRMADQVMSIPDAALGRPRSTVNTGNEEIQRKPNGPFAATPSCGEEETVRCSRDPEGAGSADQSREFRIESLACSGEPLPSSVLAFFEPRFGRDFSRVRVHANAKADADARALNAHAFTVGRNIVFGAGRYAPQSGEGKRLLAHELAHLVRPGTEGRHRLWRQIANVDVADVLDYERLAREIHEATEGWGTDEERVYGALQRLQRNPVAITRLEQEYVARYGRDLEEVIRDEFSGEELEYTLQLIGRGSAVSTQRVETIPANNAQWQAAARRLRAAMEGLGTDEEGVFAVLTPFSRNATLLNQLQMVYAALYNGESLHDQIVEEMSGSELDYALYLLGEERMETAEVGMAEATRLFTALARVTFTDQWGVPIQVPFHYPVDGCYDRAHVMENVMTEMGYRVEKVFAVSRKQVGLAVSGGLNVETEYGPDTFGPGTPAVKWWYHVAPIIRVRLNSATVQEMVMDPSILPAPSPIDQWMDRMQNPVFSRMTVDQIRNFYAAGGGWPVNQPLVFTTGRNLYYPNDILGPAAAPLSAEGKHAVNLPLIKSYAILAKVHELAAAIRRLLAAPHVAAAVLIAAIRGFPLATRMQLWMGRGDPSAAGWNDLWNAMMAAVPNAVDRTAVENSFTNP